MHLLIPAAGTGRRMGANKNKLLLPLLHQSILAWTLEAADAAASIHWIGLICQDYDRAVFLDIVAPLGLQTPVVFIGGGDSRQQSVYNGLQALPGDANRVLIHDGARCLASPELFDRCAEALTHCPGLIAAVPVKDTIKVVGPGNVIQSTPERSTLWAAQTPQGFEVALLKDCHAKGIQSGWSVTDDAALLEQCGLPVNVVPGEETNLKVTTPEDLAIAGFILAQRSQAS